MFHSPQRLRRIRLRFDEADTERTQEFTLRWSPDGGRTFREVVRQQYTFSPAGATSEVEDLNVDLAAVTALELTIIPDQRGRAYASGGVAPGLKRPSPCLPTRRLLLHHCANRADLPRRWLPDGPGR